MPAQTWCLLSGSWARSHHSPVWDFREQAGKPNSKGGGRTLPKLDKGHQDFSPSGQCANSPLLMNPALSKVQEARYPPQPPPDTYNNSTLKRYKKTRELGSYHVREGMAQVTDVGQQWVT